MYHLEGLPPVCLLRGVDDGTSPSRSFAKAVKDLPVLAENGTIIHGRRATTRASFHSRACHGARGVLLVRWGRRLCLDELPSIASW
jgi:hypothetical protein